MADRKAFAAKVEYIHMNPVKAGLCREPTDYRWSSAWIFEAGLGSWESGIVISEELPWDLADEGALSLGPGTSE